MNSLYLYFFKQYINIWKNLSLRIRIEILILFIIYFSFFTTRLISLFNEQLNNHNTTEFGFVQFVLHSLVFLISISIPFIHSYIIPRQPGITYYKSLPLNSLNTFWLLFFSHYKYQVIGLILVLPIFMAMLFTINNFLAIYFIVSVIIANADIVDISRSDIANPKTSDSKLNFIFPNIGRLDTLKSIV